MTLHDRDLRSARVNPIIFKFKLEHQRMSVPRELELLTTTIICSKNMTKKYATPWA